MTISGSADTMCSEDSICSVLQKLQITINKFQTTFNTQTKRKPQNESVQRTARRSVPPTKRPVLRKQSQLSFSPKGIRSQEFTRPSRVGGAPGPASRHGRDLRLVRKAALITAGITHTVCPFCPP